MRISAKGRYALASMVKVAEQHGENVSVISVSQTLGISKVYLEQVFTQLKKADLVVSVKGAKGGYLLTRAPEKISVWDVLRAVEASLSEVSEPTVAKQSPDLEQTLISEVFAPLDRAVESCLGGISVADLRDSARRQKSEQFYMMGL